MRRNPSGRRKRCAFLIALQMRSSVHMWSNLFGEYCLIGEPGVTYASESLKLQSDLSWLQSSHAVREQPRSPHPQIRSSGRAIERASMQIISLEPGDRVGVANGWKCVVMFSDAYSCKRWKTQLPREQPSTTASSSPSAKLTQVMHMIWPASIFIQTT